MTMKKQYKLLMMALTVLLIWGCNDDDSPRVALFDVQINSLYPEDFAQENAPGVVLKLVNNATGQVQEKNNGWRRFGYFCGSRSGNLPAERQQVFKFG